MEKMKFKRSILLGLLSFGMAYYILMRMGLSAGPQPTTEEVLYSVPLLVCSFLVYGVLLYEVMQRRHKTMSGPVMLVVGFSLMITGYWVSALTRYHVVAVITEGQTIQLENIERLPASGYAGRYAHAPRIEMKLFGLTPAFRSDGAVLKHIEGDFLLSKAGKEDRIRISDGFPVLREFVRFNIHDMGYSPRYELKIAGSDSLESSFVFLNIFPPGREDSFRLMSPLTYYVRILPDIDPTGMRLLHLRIARNKDLVFDKDVKLGEEVAFENVRLNFPEMRKWSLLEITKDYGLPVSSAGLVVFLIGLLRLLRQDSKTVVRLTDRD